VDFLFPESIFRPRATAIRDETAKLQDRNVE